MRGTLSFSFRCAFAGLYHAFRRERNLRIHSVFAALVLSWAVVFRLPVLSFLWLGLAISLVIVTELVNTALEVVVDLVSPSHHPLAGLAKDIASGAVLFACIFAVFVGVAILGPSLWERL